MTSGINSTRRRFSLGDFILEPNDVLTDEMRKQLPAGREHQLKDHGWLEERNDTPETVLRRIDALEARVARLEAQSTREPPRRGRPRKRALWISRHR